MFGFTCDAFTGTGTRTGTMNSNNNSILAVTQVGTNYTAVSPVTTPVTGLLGPTGVAVDASGNVYIADGQSNAFKKWSASAGLVTTTESSISPFAVATDAAGNVYIADQVNNVVKKWSASSKTITTLITGLSGPSGVAVDAAGVNVYIADTGANRVAKWNSTNGLTTLISSLPNPEGVAVDAVGNVYVADPNVGTVKEWTAATASVSTVVSASKMMPDGVAVDAYGNLYISDPGNQAVQKWNFFTGQLTKIISGTNFAGVAVDPSGNVYVADTNNNRILKYNPAFETLGDTTQTVGGAAGKGSVLLSFLPVNSTATWSATTSASWLHITTASGAGGGTIQFSYDANPAATARTGAITLDSGLNLTIFQAGDDFALAWPVSVLIPNGLAVPHQLVS